jgi:hypothetical protein
MDLDEIIGATGRAEIEQAGKFRFHAHA